MLASGSPRRERHDSRDYHRRERQWPRLPKVAVIATSRGTIGGGDDELPRCERWWLRWPPVVAHEDNDLLWCSSSQVSSDDHHLRSNGLWGVFWPSSLGIVLWRRTIRSILMLSMIMFYACYLDLLCIPVMIFMMMNTIFTFAIKLSLISVGTVSWTDIRFCINYGLRDSCHTIFVRMQWKLK
jgi:hypothetical protein